MVFIKNLKIRGKLLSAFGVICLILAFVGSLVLMNLNRTGNLSKLYEEDVESIRGLHRILNQLYTIRLLVFRHLGAKDPGAMKQIGVDLDKEIRTTEKLIAAKPSYFLDDQESSKLKQLNKIWSALSVNYERAIQLSSHDMKEEGYKIINNDARLQFDEATKVFAQLLRSKNQSLDKRYKQSGDVKRKTIHGMMLAICLGVIMAIILGIVIANHISRPILALVDRAQDIAQGTLDKDLLTVTANDELGVLGKSFNKMQHELQGVIGTISRSADRLANSTKEISSMIGDQASIVSQQSSSVTEISATVDELSISSTSVAENSTTVAKISTKSLHECENGLEAMRSLTAKIGDIAKDNDVVASEIRELGKKSNEIGTVVDIIKKVADQTKLIAFNAALEASSAGEEGQRFGYVAAEIRRLADDVMQSTAKIQKKIEDIQEAMNGLVTNAEDSASRFQEGTTLVSKASSELENLVSGVKDTADAATQISLSTKQQQSSTKQVLIALQEIAAGSRQSSAAMEQISSIIQNLSKLSDTLQGMVNSFTINCDVDELGEI